MCGFRHVSSEVLCFDMLCPWLWKILAIAQHQNTLCFAIIYGGGY
jgi:hypothetical protein